MCVWCPGVWLVSFIPVNATKVVNSQSAQRGVCLCDWTLSVSVFNYFRRPLKTNLVKVQRPGVKLPICSRSLILSDTHTCTCTCKPIITVTYKAQKLDLISIFKRLGFIRWNIFFRRFKLQLLFCRFLSGEERRPWTFSWKSTKRRKSEKTHTSMLATAKTLFLMRIWFLLNMQT